MPILRGHRWGTAVVVAGITLRLLCARHGHPDEACHLRVNGSRIARLPNLLCHCMSDPSSSFYGLYAIGVPIQNRQIKTVAQKWVVLGGKVLLNRRQISREGL